MTARVRILGLVALASLAAVAAVAIAVVAADDSGSAPVAEPAPRAGRPPLSFALGFRTDADARLVASGAALYQRGDVGRALGVFNLSDSLEAKVGAAFATWPQGTLDRLEQLAKLYPASGVVQLHLGLARLWAQQGDPAAAWRAVGEEQPDTPYAVIAGNLLFPKLPRGLPAFVPSFVAPEEVTSLPAARQLGALRAAAEKGGLRESLLYGVGLQRVGRPISAGEVFRQAAERFPQSAEARVAAAVGSFDKAAPEVAFGRLGPLTRTFPDEPSVRFHLGLLLLWMGQVGEAERQLALAARTRPGSPLAREAARYLHTIRSARS